MTNFKIQSSKSWEHVKVVFSLKYLQKNIVEMNSSGLQEIQYKKEEEKYSVIFKGDSVENERKILNVRNQVDLIFITNI